MPEMDGFETFRAIRELEESLGQRPVPVIFLTGESEAAGRFGEALQNTLRSSDIIMQSHPNQFFMLLPELSEADVPAVASRVMDAWDALGYGGMVDVEFVSESVSYQDEEESRDDGVKFL